MIRLSEEILINEDIQKVWAFLSNLKFSLSFNRFHVEIKFFGPFSVNNNSEFIIVHNFGFGNLDMIAKVIECIPLKRLAISEQPIKPNKKGFSHKIVFELQKMEILPIYVIHYLELMEGKFKIFHLNRFLKES